MCIFWFPPPFCATWKCIHGLVDRHIGRVWCSSTYVKVKSNDKSIKKPFLFLVSTHLFILVDLLHSSGLQPRNRTNYWDPELLRHRCTWHWCQRRLRYLQYILCQWLSCMISSKPTFTLLYFQVRSLIIQTRVNKYVPGARVETLIFHTFSPCWTACSSSQVAWTWSRKCVYEHLPEALSLCRKDTKKM